MQTPFLAGLFCIRLTFAAMQENWSSGFPTRPDTNQPVLSNKKARRLGLYCQTRRLED